MGKQKSRASRVSLGGRQKANVAHEAKRQEKFKAKRENGTAYTYKKNPYEPGSTEYLREQLDRYEKSKSSKLPLARITSIMQKLQNQLDAEKLRAKESNNKSKK